MRMCSDWDWLKPVGTWISMDSDARCPRNIFNKRFQRSLKYECVYLPSWVTGSQAKVGIERWITFYNQRRPAAASARRLPTVV